MKIFNKGTDAKPAQAQGAAVAATVPAQPAPAAAAAPGTPAAPAPAPAGPAAPDISAILDANVKEMSERIARLASSLEGQQQERQAFDAKIEQMEERMRKLSSLTEMISAQYNPFVGDAPRERDALPSPDVGLASPPMALPPPAPAAPAGFPTLPPAAPSAPSAQPSGPSPLSLEALLGAPPAELAAPEPPAAFPSVGLDITPPSASAPGFGQSEPQPEPAPQPVVAEPGVRLWAAPSGFEGSMLMLGWADMLLKSAGNRQNLLELVNYYHNLGWLGDPARDQLLGYADGLAATDEAEGDWRADVSVHERSLLYVEKLRMCAARRSG